MSKKIWDRLKHQIERGKKGLNTGIPFQGFSTLSEYICNIQQGRYDVIFAGTGIGKTAMLNSTYVFGAIEYLQKHPEHVNDYEIINYSLEITPELQIAKHIAGRIWEDHGILTNVNEILSRGDYEISKDVADLIDTYEKELEELQSKYLFFKTKLEPDSFYSSIVKYAASRGTIHYDRDDNIVGYTPKNPNLITMITIDHIGLIDKGKYVTLKEAIDQVSRHIVFFRNMFNFSAIVLVQINRGSEQMDRRGDGDNWHPLLSDIKNTGNISEDANTVMGIASPFYLMVDKCLGFDITKFKNRYRMVKILKNRDGESNVNASFLFIGETGMYYQLGKAEEYAQSPPEQLKKINQFYRKKNESNKK